MFILPHHTGGIPSFREQATVGPPEIEIQKTLLFSGNRVGSPVMKIKAPRSFRKKIITKIVQDQIDIDSDDR